MLIQEISLVLLLISSISLVVIVGLVVFIGTVIIRLLGLFSQVNEASQAMRRDIEKLLHRASVLTDAEQRAFSQTDRTED